MHVGLRMKVCIAVALGGLAVGCHSGSGSDVAESKAAGARVAAGLLDDLVEELKSIAQQGTISDAVAPALADLRKRSDAARDRGEVDDQFHRRFGRVVRVTELLVRPAADGDRAQIHRELTSFVQDIEGADRAVDPMGGLAAVAPAMREELLRLYAHTGGPAARKSADARHFADGK